MRGSMEITKEHVEILEHMSNDKPDGKPKSGRAKIPVQRFVMCLFCCLFVVGCKDNEPQKTGKIDVGVTVSASVIPAAFNRARMTQINTTTASLMINGVRSVFSDQKAWIDVYSNGKNFLCLENEEYCWRIF